MNVSELQLAFDLNAPQAGIEKHSLGILAYLETLLRLTVSDMMPRQGSLNENRNEPHIGKAISALVVAWQQIFMRHHALGTLTVPIWVWPPSQQS